MFKDLARALRAGTAPSYSRLKFFGEYPVYWVGISGTREPVRISPSSSMRQNNNGFRMLPVLLGARIMSTSPENSG
jgi:hypothetical protein